MDELLQKISESLQKGKAKDVKLMVQEAIDGGMSAQQILNEGLLSGMNVIGVKFKANEIYVPDVLIAARAMKAGTELLKPLLIRDGVEAIGKVVMGTVKGDLHDIGKNLVAMMLEGAGFEIMDLGTDVAPEKYVAAVQAGANLVALSALLTTTMPNMKAVIEGLKAAGLRDKAKVIIGGAPVTDSYAAQIGADGYAPDASRAVNLAKSLVQ